MRTEFNAYELALLDGEIASPDGPDSPGAQFLLGVQSAVNDALDYGEVDRDDTPAEIADTAVPVYTHELFQALVDLAAYTEDLSDLGTPEDMIQAAQWSLYMVAERIARALLADEEE